MGIVLAVTVGGAWLLVAAPGRRVRAAEDILQEIRAAGLGRYWPAEPTIDWYLIRNDSKALGWEAHVRAGSDDGSFVGMNLHVIGATSAIENWALNADATQGKYLAVERAGRRILAHTKITLADGQVNVLQPMHREPPGTFKAASPAPANYLPEGMYELVISQVAAKGADAQFKLVFNERPNDYDYVDYGTLRYRALGEGPDRKVHVSGKRMGEEYATIYTLDAKGRIAEVSVASGIRHVRADIEQIVKLFPDARTILEDNLPEILRRSLLPPVAEDHSSGSRLRARSCSARRSSSALVISVRSMSL